MGKVVIANKEQLYFTDRLDDVSDSIDQIEEKLVLLSMNDDLDQLYGLDDHQIYIPVSLINKVKGKNIFVYNELEQFPFFQTSREIIVNEGEKKGVFRFRRSMVEKLNAETILSDLSAFTSILGEPERISIQKNGNEKGKFQVILLIQFKEGVMAHIDFTFGTREYMELEWSGKKQILEFHSEEMKPMTPGELQNSSLQYSVDSILNNAKDINEIQSNFKKYRSLIEGGLT